MSNVKQYRKKPVVVEAFLWDGEDWQALFDFIGMVCHVDNHGHRAVIHTLEGDMLAATGDYIIKGVKGEFYPCKPNIFEATYEAV